MRLGRARARGRRWPLWGSQRRPPANTFCSGRPHRRHGLLRAEGKAAAEQDPAPDPAAAAADGTPAAAAPAGGGGGGVVVYSAQEGGPKVLADVMEALLAAAYLDSGCDVAVARQVRAGRCAWWRGGGAPAAGLWAKGLTVQQDLVASRLLRRT